MVFKRVVTVVLAVLAISFPLLASPDRGTIQGTVTDPQGAVIPGVQVLVKNVETGVEWNLNTNSAGFYLVTELVPGKYMVRFKYTGFSTLEVSNVVVTAGGVAIANGDMKVGEPTQSVNVTAEAPLIESTPSNFTTAVDKRYVEDLPLQGRDIQTLMQLLPGVIQSAGPSGAVFGFDSQFGGFPDPLHLVGSSVSANGGQAGANAWYLEGSANTTTGAESVVVNPSPDAIAEVNLVNNGLAAEYGRTSGAVVNVVLKSGTNDLHGSVYTYNRNSYFSATNPFARRDESGRPLLQPRVNYNNPGGTLGGPVVIPKLYNGKNRTFFFASGDISILHVNANRILTVPLPGAKNGDFRGDPRYAAHCDPANGITNCLYDPFTNTGPDESGYIHRLPFPEPVIPPSRIDPLAKFFLDSYPDPNYLDPLQQGPDGCKHTCNNYLGPVGSGNTTHNYSVKIDHRLHDKHQLFITWLYNPSYYTNYRFPWNGPTAPTQVGLAGAQPYNTLNILSTVGLTSTLTPTLVNEVRASFGRQDLNPKPNLDSVTWTSEVKKRVQGLNFYLFDPQQSVPTFTTEEFSFGPQQWQNSRVGQQAYGLVDNLTKVAGKHTLKFGMNFRRNNLWSATAYGYTIWFWNTSTGDPVTYQGGNGLATMLLGWVEQGYVSSGVAYAPWQSNDDWSFYGQDEFRVNRSLTLSYGLRWDVMGWIRERHDALANFNPDAMNPKVPFKGRLDYLGTASHPDRNMYPANKGSLGPRFGFAWSPFHNSKTVIRGGFGIIYSNSMSGVFGHGNGADSTPGYSVPINLPITDSTGVKPGFILSQGAPSLPIPDLSRNQKDDVQFLGGWTARFGKAPKDPYVENWSFFLQQQLPAEFVVSAGYVGTHGLHLFGDGLRQMNYIPMKTQLELRGRVNLPVPGDPSLAPLYGCDIDPATNKSLCPAYRTLMPYPQYGAVAVLQSPDGYNIYNSGQFRVEKRFSQGFNLLAAYTISKNIVSNGLGALVANTPTATTISNKGVGRIAWIPGAAGGGSADFWTRTFAEDPDNRRRYRALAPDDTPQVLNLAGTWEIPVGKGRRFLNTGRATNAILGGWKLTQNWNFQSGVPMFFTSWACSGNYISCRPNLVGDPAAGRSSKSKAERANQWYNPNAFTAPFGNDPVLIQQLTTGLNPDGSSVDPNSLDAYWQLGNIGLRPPSGRIPGYWNADLSLAKEFRMGEVKRVSFRFDMLNALNHMNLGVPDHSWCLPPKADGSVDVVHVFGCQFGKITTIQVDPRSMQFGLKFAW